MKTLNPEQVAKQFGWELDYLTDGSPIFQCDKYYTFTSDSVRLANFVSEDKIGTLVDFCSGSGIVGLEIIGRIKTQKLVQFEIQEELANLCKYTNMFNNEKTEKVEIIIKELKSTPIYQTNLISYLAASANITNYELLENAIKLSFNNYLIANIKEEEALEEVKYSIALSLRDTYGVNEVIFNIPDSENIKISV